MIDFLTTIGPCQQPDILKIVRLIKVIIQVLFTLIPIGVIVFVSIDFFKNVIAQNTDDIKKNNKIAIKRILYGVAAFFVPTIVLAVNNMLGSLGVPYSACLANATSDGIAKYKIIYDQEKERLNSQINSNNNNNSSSNTGDNTNSNRGNGFSNIKGNKDNSKDFNNDNTGGSGNTNTGNDKDNTTSGDNQDDNKDDNTTDVKTNKKVLFVGDSRTVGMCNAVNINGDCIAEVGKGYKWLSNTASKKVKSKVSKKNSYNVVVFSLGVNDLGNVSKYIQFYNELSIKNNPKIVVTSVTQVLDDKARASGYKVTNQQVITFNEKLKNGLNKNIKFCDIYTSTYGKLTGKDGLHYDIKSYELIYNEINKCL